MENNGTQSSVQIYFTTDHSLFNFLKGNRDLNEGKLKKIVKSVENGLNLFKYCPILVNEDFYIIDGQHRFYACKLLKIPVFYIIVNNFSLRQIAEINNNTTKWKTIDFLNCYIDSNVNYEDYNYLLEFHKKHKINLSVAISLLMDGSVAQGGSISMPEFKDGNFKIKYKEKVEKIINSVEDYAPYFYKTKTRNFIKAIEVLLNSDKYEHLKVIEHIKKYDQNLDEQSSYKDYLSHIEDKFNFRRSKRVTIY